MVQFILIEKKMPKCVNKLLQKKARLIQKLLQEKRSSTGGAGMVRARPRFDEINECELDHKHKHSVLERDDD
jgi:hypothetical protein